MKKQKLALFVLLFGGQTTLCMDFVCRALEAEQKGELEKQLRGARLELFIEEVKKADEDYRRTKASHAVYKAIDIIEQGIKGKKEWQEGEVEALFNSLFSAQFPDENLEENIKRFKRLNVKPKLYYSME